MNTVLLNYVFFGIFLTKLLSYLVQVSVQSRLTYLIFFTLFIMPCFHRCHPQNPSCAKHNRRDIVGYPSNELEDCHLPIIYFRLAVIFVIIFRGSCYSCYVLVVSDGGLSLHNMSPNTVPYMYTYGIPG